MKITAWGNPVTGTEVRLDPPLEVTEAEREGFGVLFEAWCAAGWKLARLDPTELDTTGWAVDRRQTVTEASIVGLSFNADGTTTLSLRDRYTGQTYEIEGRWRQS